MTVRVRVTLVAALAAALAVTVSGWLLIRSVENSQVAHLRAQAQASVDTAAARLGAGASADEALRELETAVVVVDGDGTCYSSNPFGGDAPLSCDDDNEPQVIASSESEQERPGDADPYPSAGRSEHGPLRDMFGTGAGGSVEMISREVQAPELGTVVVAAMAPSEAINGGIAAVGPTVWVVFPALVAMVAVLAWWLTGRALRPVDAIRREAADIEASSIHRRLPEPKSNDEIGRLARTMNAMLDRLDRSARLQRQFVSDASHELRSPITASLTDLEVALGEGDRADWPSTARAVVAEQRRLDRLVDDLLLLAATDESAGSHESVTDVPLIEIEPLVTEETARRRNVPVDLEYDVDTPLPVMARISAFHLRRALGNLLDNAARLAASAVVVTVTATDTEVVLAVDDDGPGVAPADRERVFERFARLDEGRARPLGGTGLGLAVTRAVVERADGVVTVGVSPIGGARFTIRLPRA